MKPQAAAAPDTSTAKDVPLEERDMSPISAEYHQGELFKIMVRIDVLEEAGETCFNRALPPIGACLS